jgi:hypothetical protein
MPNGGGRHNRQGALQQTCLLGTGADNGGSCTAGFEGGDDISFDDEAIGWVSGDDEDPFVCREWDLTRFQHVPRPAPHSSSERIAKVMGTSADGDSCTMLAASLQELECAGVFKKHRTEGVSHYHGVKRSSEDIAWLHNATSSAAREVQYYAPL